MNSLSFFISVLSVLFAFFFVYSISHGYFDGSIIWLALLAFSILIRLVPDKKKPKSGKRSRSTSPITVSAIPEQHSFTYSGLTRKIIGLPVYNRLFRLFITKTQKISPLAGKPTNAYALANSVAIYFFAISLCLFTSSIILPIFTGFAFFALLAFVPFLFPYVPSVYFDAKIRARQADTDADFPFFLQFVDTLNYVHVLLPQALSHVKNSRVFSGISKESELFEYFVKVGKTDLEAIRLIADNHPSRALKDFFKNYTSMLRTDTAALDNAINRAAAQSYDDFKQQIKSKQNMITPLFGLTSIAAVVGPVSVVFLLKLPSVPADILLLAINALPFALLFVLLSVGTIRAFANDVLPFYPATIIPGIISALVSYVIWDVYVALAIGISVTCFANWLLTRKQDLEILEIENSIVNALEQIERKSELKQDILEIIRWFENDDLFPDSFKRVFVKLDMDFSLRPKTAHGTYLLAHPSYMLRLMLFVLYTIYVSSRTNPGAIRQFTTMMDKAIKAKHDFRKAMFIQSLMMMASPVAIVMAYVGIVTMFPSDSMIGLEDFAFSVVDDDTIANGLKPSVLFFGLTSGLATSINIMFSVRRTLPIAVSTGLAAIVLVLWDQIISASAWMSQ